MSSFPAEREPSAPLEIHRERQECLCFMRFTERGRRTAAWTWFLNVLIADLDVYGGYLHFLNAGPLCKTGVFRSKSCAAGACALASGLCSLNARSLLLPSSSPFVASCLRPLRACVLLLIPCLIFPCHCSPPCSLFLMGPWGFANPVLIALLVKPEKSGRNQSPSAFETAFAILSLGIIFCSSWLLHPVNPLSASGVILRGLLRSCPFRSRVLRCFTLLRLLTALPVGVSSLASWVFGFS